MYFKIQIFDKCLKLKERKIFYHLVPIIFVLVSTVEILRDILVPLRGIKNIKSNKKK